MNNKQNNKTNDLWFNIYVFLLLPFCILINIWNIVKYIKQFNYLNNMFITIFQFIICVVSIGYYAYTFYYAKDRVKKAYMLIIISIFYSVVIASFNQTITTYYDQGIKTYLMFLVYLVLFLSCYGFPNYVYFKRRKDYFIMSNVISKELLKSKIKEAMDKKQQEKK